LRYVIVVILSFIISLTACKKLNELTAFNLQYTAHVTLPVIISTGQPVSIYSPDVPNDADSVFAAYHTVTDKIDKVNLSESTLTITSPSAENFNFLSSISVCMVAGNLTEKRIAWKDNVPDNVGNQLDLEVTSDNLRAYFSESSFSFHVTVVTDSTIVEQHEIDIYSKFRVHARVIN